MGTRTAALRHQNRYWISYEDEYSASLKARYANQYGLKGTFVWEVDAHNFLGLFNSKPFTILKALNQAAISGQGLSGDEILGHGNENLGRCAPEAPMCSITWPACTEDNDCELSDAICNNDYSSCSYCDGYGTCKPGGSRSVFFSQKSEHHSQVVRPTPTALQACFVMATIFVRQLILGPSSWT